MPKIRAGCPGKNTAFLKDFKTNTVPCPKCGHEIEFFADEVKVKCPKCGTNVFKVNPKIIDYRNGKLVFGEIDKSCLDWCGGCLNRNDYKDIEENKKRIDKKKKDIEKLINTVSKKDKDVIEFFVEAFKISLNNPKLIDEKVFQALQKENPGLFIKARNYYLNFLNS